MYTTNSNEPNADMPVKISKLVDNIKKIDVNLRDSKIKADTALEAAKKAKNNKISIFGGRKEAIEVLQSSVEMMATAIHSNTDAHILSFEFQKGLQETTKDLFALGAMNIANNRIVVRQLELKLKNASEEELSDLAQQELISVIQQLKAQEDILKELDLIKTKTVDAISQMQNESQKNYKDLKVLVDRNKRLNRKTNIVLIVTILTIIAAIILYYIKVVQLS